jgi:serine protease inhibitor
MDFSKIFCARIFFRIVFSFILVAKVSAQDLENLAGVNNDFAFNLFKQIATAPTNENIFLSPFSVATALQMLVNGAAGKTKLEIQNVLQTTDLPSEKINAACKKLNQSLQTQTNVILDLADSIWFQNDFHLKSNFVAANQNFFRAELAGVDFESPISAQIINDWAEKKTRGKITDIVAFPFPPLTRVILANAIYFKGKWAEPFDKSQTQPRDFYLANGDSNKVPMMSQQRKFSYSENENFQAVQLAYAGNRLQMILFLPATNSSPQKLLKDLSSEKWRDEILPAFGEREGSLTFPKFKLDYKIELNEPLKSLGMRQAFSSDANFSAMADAQLFISEVKQKSFVAVDEEGTEAAAVTVVHMERSARRLNEPFKMLVNRPFLFVIADARTQAILFMGIVNDPAKK